MLFLLRQFVVFIFIQGCLSGARAENTIPERVMWDDQPIPLHITTGQERRVSFPSAIRYWLPDQLQSKLTVLAANGVLYLQAHQSFQATRIRVQLLPTQQLILLDVDASPAQGSIAKVIVHLPDPITDDLNHSVDQQQRASSDWYERLTRHAAQQLYAPERLLNSDPLIERVPIEPLNVASLLRDSRLAATLLASWAGGGLYLTAITLHNTSNDSLDLYFSEDTRSALPSINVAKTLRGQWLAASVQHATVGPRATHDDSTILYVISDRPFYDRLGR